jgi:hypothetical protein
VKRYHLGIKYSFSIHKKNGFKAPLLKPFLYIGGEKYERRR